MAAGNSHGALEQALGYLYQFDRATRRLFLADPSVIAVGIEHVDDVSIHRNDGSEVREQDKATTGRRNPLADSSIAVWKTLAIWLEYVGHHPEALQHTEFHIVTNGVVPPTCLAHAINAAKEPTAASRIAAKLLTKAQIVRQGLKPFAQGVRSTNPDTLTALILRTFVTDRVSPHFGGGIDDIQALRLFEPSMRVAIFDEASAWIRRRIREGVSNGGLPLIRKDDFDRQIMAIVRHLRLDPFSPHVPPADSVAPSEHTARGFVKQLEWIELGSDAVHDAIIHYARAEAARMKWTDDAIVSESALLAYQDDLITRWSLIDQKLRRRQWPSPSAQGQAVLEESLEQETVLNGTAMPKVVTCGTFHALAEFTAASPAKVGWHPDFRSLSGHREGLRG